MPDKRTPKQKAEVTKTYNAYKKATTAKKTKTAVGKTDGRAVKTTAHRKAISEGLKAYWAKQKRGNKNAGKLTAHGKKVAAERKASGKKPTPVANQTVISKWNATTDKEAKKLYATFSEAKIRKYQDLANAQMKTAHKQGNTEALESLSRMSDALMREMLRRTNKPAVGGGASMKRNVSMRQLTGIITKAESGGYGNKSAAILKKAKADLAKHTKAKTKEKAARARARKA